MVIVHAPKSAHASGSVQGDLNRPLTVYQKLLMFETSRLELSTLATQRSSCVEWGADSAGLNQRHGKQRAGNAAAGARQCAGPIQRARMPPRRRLTPGPRLYVLLTVR